MKTTVISTQGRTAASEPPGLGEHYRTLTLNKTNARE